MYNFSLLPKHHALLFVTSNRGVFLENIVDHFKKEKQYFEIISATVIGKEEQVTLLERAGRFFDREVFFILSFSSINREAQNALLKLLEEPKKGIRFILITSDTNSLLPTVISRLFIAYKEKENSLYEKEALIFLETKRYQRMELPFIKKLLEAVDEEGKKDREKVSNILISILSASLRAQLAIPICKEVTTIIEYSRLPASQGKMLLEYAALRLPEIKK